MCSTKLLILHRRKVRIPRVKVPWIVVPDLGVGDFGTFPDLSSLGAKINANVKSIISEAFKNSGLSSNRKGGGGNRDG